MTDIQILNLCNKMSELTLHRLANGWKELYSLRFETMLLCYIFNAAMFITSPFLFIYVLETTIIRVTTEFKTLGETEKRLSLNIWYSI